MPKAWLNVGSFVLLGPLWACGGGAGPAGTNVPAEAGMDSGAAARDARREQADGPSGSDLVVAQAMPDAAAVEPPTAARLQGRAVQGSICRKEAMPDRAGHRLALRDMNTVFTDGTDLLARVNRSVFGTLPPEFEPPELVDWRTLQPGTRDSCEYSESCLRRDAALALRRMFAAMSQAGVPGEVHSAYRSYTAQCRTFERWSRASALGMCWATQQSALAGHSQHQLGTTADLFTRSWVLHGQVFRNGFGCTPGAQWLQEHSWEYGWIRSYTLHPDLQDPRHRCEPRDEVPETIDARTGYRAESWHYRYLGTEQAARFRRSWEASGPNTTREITLDQWLRREQGLVGDIDLPVCDGCSCGACGTLEPAADESDPGPCGTRALWYRRDGSLVVSTETPKLRAVSVHAWDPAKRELTLDLELELPEHTLTQTPTFNREDRPLEATQSWDSMVVLRKGIPHRYEDLPRAWRVALRPAGSTAPWPLRLGLAENTATEWNGANLYLPAESGSVHRVWKLQVAPNLRAYEVALWHDGQAVDARTVQF